MSTEALLSHIEGDNFRDIYLVGKGLKDYEFHTNGEKNYADLFDGNGKPITAVLRLGLISRMAVLDLIRTKGRHLFIIVNGTQVVPIGGSDC